MNNTKKKILNTSRLLFNEKGINNVTIRMIALKLNMSSGNLNYHYKKREDILEALYFEMVYTFDKRIKDLDKEVPSINKMHEDIKVSISRMVVYKFFWTDLYNILQLNSKIKAHFDSVYINRKNGLIFVLNTFVDNKIMNPFENEKQQIFLVERMINFGNTCLYASSLYAKNEFSSKFIITQTNSLIMYLYPYLTDLGKKRIQKLMPQYF